VTDDGRKQDHTRLLARRVDILDALREGPLPKRDLVDRVDASRSTVDRAVRSLKTAGYVDRTDGGYVATLAGLMAVDQYREYSRTVADIGDAAEALSRLPPDCDIPAAAVAGSDVSVATTPTPYRPAETLHETVAGADAYRALLPSLDGPRHIRVCYENVVTEGSEVDLVVDPDLLDSLQDDFPRRLSRMAEDGRFSVAVGDIPPYGLAVVENDGERTVLLVVFSDAGNVHAVVRNDADRAVEWANAQFDRYWDGSDDATERLTGGGTDSYANGAKTWLASRRTALPDPLKVQGFVRLSRSYFTERSTADPVTSWRTGLSLADVQADHAVDRDGPDSLTDRLRDHLRSGTDCALLGPPGCGKSTVCKQVACRWYRDDRGPVLYRPSDRGRAFDAVEQLRSVLNESDGHALVVVEDAVRPGARQVFEVVQAVHDRDDVTFLFDARTGEWHDPPGEPLDAALRSLLVDEVRTISMPPLSDDDCEAFVEHVERTVPDAVEVPTDRLRETLESDREDDAAPVGVLLLLHRAALYADPLAEEATTLEADVRAVYDDLAGAGDAALDAGVLVNLLNAVNRDVRPATVEAAFAERDPDAVRDGLARLEERAVFTSPGADDQPADEAYETVHETWSVQFLAHLLDAEGEGAAAERFGRCLTSYLSLADDPDRAAQAGTSVPADPLADRTEWADEAVEGVFGLGLRVPRLAPLFGTADDSAIELPGACSSVTAYCCLRWRGRMYANGSDFECAEREYRALLDQVRETDELDPDTATELEAFALTYLGRALDMQNETDAAESVIRQALDEFDLSDRERANCLHNLGVRRYVEGDFEAALDCLSEAVELRRSISNRRLVASSLQVRGNLYRSIRWNFPRAEADLRESLELARETEYDVLEALARDGLGDLYRECGPFDVAEEQYARCLEIGRDIGFTDAVVSGYRGLGFVARRRGDLESSERYFERAVDIAEELPDRMRRLFTAAADEGGGGIAIERGEYETAREYLRAARQKFRDVFQPGVVDCTLHLVDRALRVGELDEADRLLEGCRDELDDRDHGLLLSRWFRHAGRLAMARDEPGEADDHFHRSLDHARAARSSYEEGKTLVRLGELACERDAHGEAKECLTDAVELFRECGAVREAIGATEQVVTVCKALGDFDAAAEWREAALTVAESTDFDPGHAEFLDECQSQHWTT